MADYPGAQPTFTSLDTDDLMNETGKSGPEIINRIHDQIKAIAAELGINPSGDEASVLARFAALDSSLVPLPSGGTPGVSLLRLNSAGTGLEWNDGGGGGGGGGTPLYENDFTAGPGTGWTGFGDVTSAADLLVGTGGVAGVLAKTPPSTVIAEGGLFRTVGLGPILIEMDTLSMDFSRIVWRIGSDPESDWYGTSGGKDIVKRTGPAYGDVTVVQAGSGEGVTTIGTIGVLIDGAQCTVYANGIAQTASPYTMTDNLDSTTAGFSMQYGDADTPSYIVSGFRVIDPADL